MATCLVTGGAGFIGSHVVEALLAQGYQVRVLDNLLSGQLSNLEAVRNRVEFIQGSVDDKGAVKQAVAGTELIFHLAAIVSVPRTIEYPEQAEVTNAVGTLNILGAAKENGVRRVVFSSTAAIYGDEPTLPKVETQTPYPKVPYAISKLAAEYYCQFYTQSFGLETVVLRYFNAFGPRQDPSSPYSGVISIFLNKLQQGVAPTIFGDGQQTRDFVYVSDIARANLLASQVPQAAGQVFNIGTGVQVSLNQLFDNLSDILVFDEKPVYQPTRSGDIRYSVADVTKAQKILGWSPQITFEDGLRQLAASMQGNN